MATNKDDDFMNSEDSSYGSVVVERGEAGVYRVMVANAAKLNILNSHLLKALRGAFARIADDEKGRLIVLRGEGDRAWIGGADITEMSGFECAEAEAFIRALHGLCADIRTHPLPVIGEIRGYCLGAGLEVAACCDLRLACDGATFGMPEVRVGIPSVIDAALLPRLIGSGRARDLVLTARTIDTQTALAWGFLDGCASKEKFPDLVAEREQQLLAAAPLALRAQKKLCNDWEELPLTQAIEAGVVAYRAAYESDEPHDYMRRFMQRKRHS